VLAGFQDPALADALETLTAFEDSGSAAAMADPVFRRAAAKVGFAGDALGVMVFYRIVPLHMLDDLMGRFVRLSWTKVKPYAEAQRRRFGHNNYFEWFQWLAERLQQHPVAGKSEGAHVFHRHWKP
jgi:hypothetical protein